MTRREIGQEIEPMTCPAGEGAAARARRRSRLTRAAWVIGAVALIGACALAFVKAGGVGGAPRPADQSNTAARNFSLPELGRGGETPVLASFYRAHHSQVAFIGVDSDDQAEAALRFLASNHVSYPVAVDAFPDPVGLAYKIATLPQTFVLNSRHQIIEHLSGAVTRPELSAWAASLATARRR